MELIGPHTNGVYILSVTPFSDQGDIDWASVDCLVEFYIDKGVSGITILGMMGEVQKLSETESAVFAKYFIERVAGRVPVIAGVSHAGTDNLVRLAKSVMADGASGVMIAPTAGLKTEAQISDYFAGIFERLGSAIPVCFQDYPGDRS
jgi:4-hydroxy-tetrahydrodipicolinate synthase